MKVLLRIAGVITGTMDDIQNVRANLTRSQVNFMLPFIKSDSTTLTIQRRDLLVVKFEDDSTKAFDGQTKMQHLAMRIDESKTRGDNVCLRFERAL